MEMKITGLEKSGASTWSLLWERHLFTEVSQITVLTKLENMNQHQMNVWIWAPNGLFFPENKNVMFRKKGNWRNKIGDALPSFGKKNGDVAPSATLLIRYSTIRNLQKLQRAWLFSRGRYIQSKRQEESILAWGEIWRKMSLCKTERRPWGMISSRMEATLLTLEYKHNHNGWRSVPRQTPSGISVWMNVMDK